MKPLVRDMVRVGVSVSVVTGLVLLPAYFLYSFNDCCRQVAGDEQAPDTYNLSIVPLDEDWSYLGAAINDRGEIVGTAFDEENNVRAFIRRGKKNELLPLPKGAPMSAATDINESGAIIGSAGSIDKVRGVLWRGKKLDALTYGKSNTFTTTISNDGVVAGIAVNPSDSAGFRLDKIPLYSKNQRVDRLFRFESGAWNLSSNTNLTGVVWKSSGEGKSIGEFTPQGGNAKGILAGITFRKDAPVPALFKAGKVVTLPQPEGTQVAVAQSINSDEIAVGTAVLVRNTTGKMLPVRWSNGKAEFLPVPDNRQGIALSINAQKTIVGSIQTEDSMAHAAMWQDGKVTDLNNLVDDKDGWILAQARDINNNGQIMGIAVRGEQVATFVIGFQKSDP